MAISYVGGADDNSNSLTTPAILAGDLLIGSAFRTNNQVNVPAGWTIIADNGAGVETTNAFVVGYWVADADYAAGYTTGQFGATNRLIVDIYRGCDTTDPIGGNSGVSAPGGSTPEVPSVTMEVTDGTSWCYTSWGMSSGSSDAPAGTVLRSQRNDSSSIQGFDTNGGVSSYAPGATNASNVQNRMASFELLAAGGAANNAPVVNAGSDDSGVEGSAYTTHNVSATDADGDTLTLSCSTLPSGLSFTDNGNGTGTITGTPAVGTAASSPYTVTITANDGTDDGVDSYTLTISEAAPSTVTKKVRQGGAWVTGTVHYRSNGAWT